MPRIYRHFTFEERCQVKIPKKSGLSKGSIAQHPTLISIRTTHPHWDEGRVLHFRLEVGECIHYTIANFPG